MMDGREKKSVDRSTRSTGRSTGRSSERSGEGSKQQESRAQHSRTVDRASEHGESTDRSKLCNQLDFLSSYFNPELVLQVPEDAVQLPVPNAKIFNNLDEYALKSFPVKRPAPAASNSTKPNEQTDLDILRRQYEIKERMRSQIEVLDVRQVRGRQSEVKTVLSLMESDESGLGKFLNSRLRIFVRRRRKSKHPCERYACLFGQLMFFDRHWNLILSDVSETMQFVRKSSAEEESGGLARDDGKHSAASINDENGSNSNSKATGLSESLISSIDNRRLLIGRTDSDASTRISIRERHFTRLFIRGDNIIYISKV